MAILVQRISASTIFVLVASCGVFAHAQDDIDFGDDSHPFANDGLCSDSRFFGQKALGADGTRIETHQDATDCRTLYVAGEIQCFSRRRCADESLESRFRRLDVRKSLIEDMTDGLAPERRAMVYVEPQQTRGNMEFTSVEGTPIRRKKIVLIEPGTYRFGVTWISPSPLVRFHPDSSGRFDGFWRAFRLTGDQQFELTVEAGKSYRVYPARLFVRDASLVDSTLRPMNKGIRRQTETAETLAVWVVDADTGAIVVDQRDDY